MDSRIWRKKFFNAQRLSVVVAFTRCCHQAIDHLVTELYQKESQQGNLPVLHLISGQFSGFSHAEATDISVVLVDRNKTN